MPQVSSQDLITQLQEDVKVLRQFAETYFVSLSDAQLLEAPGPAQWSIAQCLAHLTSYGLYYLPLLEKAIHTGERSGLKSSEFFRSGWLGNYVANSMRPGADGRIRFKSKAVKHHTPGSQLDARKVLNEFFEQQAQLIALLDRAKGIDLGSLHIPISIAHWIKLSLGDTFRFLIAHEQRHILQAQRVLKNIDPTAPTTLISAP